MSTTSGYDDWLAANDRFLGEAVRWLRHRLEQLADSQGGPAPAAGRTEGAEPASRHLGRRRRNRGAQEPAAPAAPAQVTAGSAQTVPTALTEAERLDEPPPLVLLTRRLGLTAFERDVLLLAVAMELDTRIGALCARAQHDAHRPYPTFALALSLFDEPAWDVMSPERPLRHWQLVDIDRGSGRPLTGSPLRADERIVGYIKGLNHLDERLRPLLRPVEPPREDDLAASQLAVAGAVAAAARRAASDSEPAVLQLLGADPVSKRLIASQAAGELGLHLFAADGELLPTGTADLDLVVRLWQRETLLSPVALYLGLADMDRNGGTATAARRLLADRPGLVLLDLHEPWPELAASAPVLETARPTPAEQRAAWQRRLGDRAGDHPDQLSAQFDFGLPTIRRLAFDALDTGDDVPGQVWTGALRQSRHGLDRLAQRLEPKATWHDLKLPTEQQQLLRRIAEQVRHRSLVYDTYGFRDRMNRGLGISALFAGESGTGKTMAAEALANALDLLLYRIDLSAVVSKYIGETEKNLRLLFDAADAGGAILFFDEADALFGKRTEVKDSHDRYANIEINYLLQRMETFGGLAVLATNRKSALDTAFLRRLRFIVNFPFPGVPERTEIWSAVFPAGTPVGLLDVERLARLNLSGGSIANIAVNAAFAAAAGDGEVTMPVVLEAARVEFRKLDKPINEADFRWLESAGGSA